MLTYHDSDGRQRLKRRYAWGFWSFLLGMVIGMLLISWL